MRSRLEIVAESPADRAAVRRVNTLAFGQPNEADLAEALRAAGTPLISLVARDGGEVVGHILFTVVTVDSGVAGESAAGGAGSRQESGRPSPAVWTALALGPMAVLPARQRQGVGSRLAKAGLDACRERGESIVFVVGHTEYYPRFGFVPASPLGFECEFRVPENVFMVAELEPGSLHGRRGLVRYHPLFSTV